MVNDAVKNCKETGQANVFSRLFSKLPTWDDFLSHINESVREVEYTGGNMGAKERVGKVNFWSRLTMTVDSPELRFYSGLDEYIKTLSDMHYYSFAGCFSAISFTNVEPSTGRHNDPVDVFYLQCIGKVTWVVGENDPKEYVLGPGDVIYVPSGVMHEVKSLTPRAALSFMFKE